MITLLKQLFFSKPSFEIPDNVKLAIAHYINTINSNPTVSFENIMSTAIGTSVEQSTLWEICGLFPIAAGRVMLKDFSNIFKDNFQVFDPDGKCVQVGLLSKNTTYQSCLESIHLLGKQETLAHICTSSAEVQVINQALKNGSNISDLVLAPIVLMEYSPQECV